MKDEYILSFPGLVTPECGAAAAAAVIDQCMVTMIPERLFLEILLYKNAKYTGTDDLYYERIKFIADKASERYGVPVSVIFKCDKNCDEAAEQQLTVKLKTEGCEKRKNIHSESSNFKNCSIVMCGPAGKGGASVIAAGYVLKYRNDHFRMTGVSETGAVDNGCFTEKNNINGAYENIPVMTEDLIRRALEADFLITGEQISAARDSSVALSQAAGKDGIFKALWNIGELTDGGISAWLDRIDIDQDTIEICEIFRINPYKLFSPGSVLYVTDDPVRLCSRLSKNGKKAAVIGFTEDSNDRVIIRRGERQYLFPETEDELVKALGRIN